MMGINKNFFDEMYTNSIIPKIEKIDKDLSIVKDLDAQIERLVYQRSLILDSAASAGLELCNTKQTWRFDAQKFENEYSEHGFNSDTVKNVIEIVRCAFFNDELEEFKKFDCVEVNFGDNYDKSINFEFSDDSGCDIGISVPNMRIEDDDYYGMTSYAKRYQSNSERRFLSDGEFIDCSISFYIRYKTHMICKDGTSYDRRVKKTIAYSKNMFEIRKAISDFVMRDKSISPQKYHKYEFSHYSFIDMVGQAMDLEFETRR